MKYTLFTFSGKVILLLFLLQGWLCISSLYAQSGSTSATAGKEFYITYGQNRDGNNVTLQLKVVVEKACYITAKYNNQASAYWNNWNDTWVTPGIYTQNVSNNDVVNTSTGETLKTITLTSTEDVCVYAINCSSISTDATCILPCPTWGKEYRLATGIPGGLIFMSNPSYYAVVAREDNTDVTLHNGASITLNKNQAYHFYSEDFVDLTGEKVTSTKPVALFSGAAHTQSTLYYCSFGNFSSHTYEQLWSIDKWGKEFFTFPIFGAGFSNLGGMLAIVADEEGTMVTLSGGINGGTPVNYSLNAGQKQYVCHVMSGLTRIVSNKPIMVFLMLNNVTITNIAPVAQRIQHATVSPFVLTGNEIVDQHAIDMLLPAAYWDKTVIKENGAVVFDTTYTVNLSIHFPDWYHIRKDFPNVDITIDITCPGGFLAYISGYRLIAGNDAYGFTAGVGAYDLQNYFTIQEKATEIDTYYENTIELTHTFEASDVIVVKRTVEKDFTSIKWLINGESQSSIIENTESMNTLYFPASASDLYPGENFLTMAVRYAGATQDSTYTGRVWLENNPNSAAFYANNVHHDNLKDTVFCNKNVYFNAVIEGEYTEIEWYIDDVEYKPENPLEWSKPFETKTYNIKMQVRFENGNEAIREGTLRMEVFWIKIRNVRH